jgi:hypothetical protein
MVMAEPSQSGHENKLRNTRFEAGIFVRLSIVGLMGYLTALNESEIASIALVLTLWVIPLSVLAPARWKGQVSEGRYERLALLISLGMGIVIVASAYADSDSRPATYPRTAAIFAAGAVHLALIWFVVRPRVADIPHLRIWSSASLIGIAGVLVDLPQPPGWHTATYFLYGAVASTSFRRLVDDPQQR